MAKLGKEYIKHEFFGVPRHKLELFPVVLQNGMGEFYCLNAMCIPFPGYSLSGITVCYMYVCMVLQYCYHRQLLCQLGGTAQSYV